MSEWQLMSTGGGVAPAEAADGSVAPDAAAAPLATHGSVAPDAAAPLATHTTASFAMMESEDGKPHRKDHTKPQSDHTNHTETTAKQPRNDD